MVCLVLLMYLLTSVMSRLALTLSPSFLGVRTTVLYQSVGSSPTSSMMPRLCHLSRIWSNFSFRGIYTLLRFWTAPGVFGTPCSLTVAPFRFPIPVKTSSYFSTKSSSFCRYPPWLVEALLLFSQCDTLRDPYFRPPGGLGVKYSFDRSLRIRVHQYSSDFGLRWRWNSQLKAMLVPGHLPSNSW